MKCGYKMIKKRIYLSLVLAVAAYFLGIVAEANHETDSAIYMASCFSKIIFYLIAVPLAHNAGKIIRQESNVIGNPGLRFVGWIMYGVAIGHFITFFIQTADGSRLPDGQITIDSAIFFIASMLMIAEAWNSYKMKD
jgi:disulfide bond formation protein DsbB